MPASVLSISFNYPWLYPYGYIVMLRARIFRSLVIRTGIEERNIRARNITIQLLY